jgi:hypothetical protein
MATTIRSQKTAATKIADVALAAMEAGKAEWDTIQAERIAALRDAELETCIEVAETVLADAKDDLGAQFGNAVIHTANLLMQGARPLAQSFLSDDPAAYPIAATFDNIAQVARAFVQWNRGTANIIEVDEKVVRLSTNTGHVSEIRRKDGYWDVRNIDTGLCHERLNQLRDKARRNNMDVREVITKHVVLALLAMGRSIRFVVPGSDKPADKSFVLKALAYGAEKERRQVAA